MSQGQDEDPPSDEDGDSEGVEAEDEFDLVSEPQPDEGDPEDPPGDVAAVAAEADSSAVIDDEVSVEVALDDDPSADDDARASAGDGPVRDDDRDGDSDDQNAATRGSVDSLDLDHAAMSDDEVTSPRIPAPASVPPPAPPGGPLPDIEAGDRPRRGLRVMAVTGARGGVGKSVLASNLAVYLATIGRRVVLVDADSAGANLHTCVGASLPPPLSRARRGNRGDGPLIPEELLRPTQVPSLRLLYAGFDEPAAGSPRSDRMTKLIAKLRTLDAEYVVVDLGMGMGRDLLDAYLAADTSVFVTAPEPTAIETTYRFMRGAFMRRLIGEPLGEEDHGELERRFKALGGVPAPLDLLHDLEEEGHPLAARVRTVLDGFRPTVVINQTRLRADLQLGFALQSAARRRLGLSIEYIGHIDHDDTVWTCLRNRRPVLLEVPGAKSSKKIEKIARRLLIMEAGKDATRFKGGVPENSHHDLLEVDRGATEEEIRRAYKRCREVYAHDAMCCYGLLEANEIEKLRTRLDEAFDVLLDPSRRRPYELSVFTDEPEPDLQAAEAELETEPPRPGPEITPDTQFTGAILQQVRESKRVSLRNISQRTKISVAYLDAIEKEHFRQLPALVYARGFVTEYARYLKLEPQQVSRTYIGRYKRYLEERSKGTAGVG